MLINAYVLFSGQSIKLMLDYFSINLLKYEIVHFQFGFGLKYFIFGSAQSWRMSDLGGFRVTFGRIYIVFQVHYFAGFGNLLAAFLIYPRNARPENELPLFKFCPIFFKNNLPEKM